MRPKKTRWVECGPESRLFLPRCKNPKTVDEVLLSLDEFEALRLHHLEGLEQGLIAKGMKVHRTTVSRIISSAHRKLLDALVNMKAIRVGGGCCRYKSLGD